MKPIKKEDIIYITKKALDHKKLIDENEEYRLNLETIFNSVNDGILKVDKEQNIVEINKAFAKICGFVDSDSKGKAFNTVCKSNTRCKEAIVKTVKTQQAVEIRRVECKLNPEYSPFPTI